MQATGLGYHQLAGQGSPEDVIREFEALFMSLIVRHIREGTIQNGLFGYDPGGIYSSFFDVYLGQELARSQPLGIGHILRKHLIAGAEKENVK
ncbi:MAG: hypothetical protein C4297_04090 [Gemmataceae bacterium]